MFKIIITGIMFGDEGKGRWSDYFSGLFSTSTIVRFTGGPQGGHHKLCDDNTGFCFSSFGSGMFNSGSKTYISPYTLIHVPSFLIEAEKLEEKGIIDIFDRVKIHQNARVITPVHTLVCRMREIERGSRPNGSVGYGVGEATTGSPIFVKDFLNKKDLACNLRSCFAEKLDIAQQIVDSNPNNSELREMLLKFKNEDLLNKSFEMYCYFGSEFRHLIVDDSYWNNLLCFENLIFEGTQGVLLDPIYGFQPHITRTRTTTINAEALLGNLKRDAVFIGLLRAFTTRHGPGPFPTKDLTLNLREMFEIENRWNGKSESGYLDLLLARYGLQTNNRIDYLAISCLDRLIEMDIIKICTSYQYVGKDLDYLDKFFEWDFVCGKTRITGLKSRNNLSRSEHLIRTRMMFNCKPFEFVTFPNWNMDISNIRDFSLLPNEAKNFINYIEEQLAVPVCMVSVGPSREQVVILKDIF